MGSMRAVAGFRGVVAVGYSNAVVGVLMPRGLSSDGHPSGSVYPAMTSVPTASGMRNSRMYSTSEISISPTPLGSVHILV